MDQALRKLPGQSNIASLLNQSKVQLGTSITTILTHQSSPGANKGKHLKHIVGCATVPCGLRGTGSPPYRREQRNRKMLCLQRLDSQEASVLKSTRQLFLPSLNFKRKLY